MNDAKQNLATAVCDAGTELGTASVPYRTNLFPV